MSFVIRQTIDHPDESRTYVVRLPSGALMRLRLRQPWTDLDALRRAVEAHVASGKVARQKPPPGPWERPS